MKDCRSSFWILTMGWMKVLLFASSSMRKSEEGDSTLHFDESFPESGSRDRMRNRTSEELEYILRSISSGVSPLANHSKRFSVLPHGHRDSSPFRLLVEFLDPLGTSPPSCASPHASACISVLLRFGQHAFLFRPPHDDPGAFHFKYMILSLGMKLLTLVISAILYFQSSF